MVHPDAAAKFDGTDLKYVTLAATMRRGILAGSWAVGSKLPTEKELIDSTGLSLTTVRRALQELVDEGLVSRRRGARSFVAPWVARAERSDFVIGVMVPETSLYYDRVIQGIQDQLAVTRAGSALLATYDWVPERESQALKLLMDSGVDGLILTPIMPRGAGARAVLEEAPADPLPVVLAERGAAWAGPSGTMEHVVSDRTGGACDAVAHLYRLGQPAHRPGVPGRDPHHRGDHRGLRPGVRGPGADAVGRRAAPDVARAGGREPVRAARRGDDGRWSRRRGVLQ